MSNQVIPAEVATLAAEGAKAVGNALATVAVPQKDPLALKQVGEAAKCAEKGCLTNEFLAAQKEANLGSYIRQVIGGLIFLGGLALSLKYGNATIKMLIERGQPTPTSPATT